MPEAKQGDTVRVHYTGRLDDGEVFDSSEDGEPLQFRVGDGEVIKGFDQGVRGMQVGEKKTIEVDADDAYGQRVEALVQRVPRAGINLDVEPQAGMQLMLQLPDGNEIPVAISEVTDEQVTLDANHPLAGEKLIFVVTLLAVS